MTESRAAVFLDRDGTLIEDVGILNDPSYVHLLPGVAEALLELQKTYTLFVMTRQPGVARGLLTLDQVKAVNARLDEMLRQRGVVIERWYVCPHSREDECPCMTPRPGFVLEARKEFNLDLERSFAVGDHHHDTLMANELGVLGLYVLTGHGGRHLSDLPADVLVFHRFPDAAEWILRHQNHRRMLDDQIAKGAAIIQRGGAVAFPTETVYGLGADALNAEAVARIFEIKGRPADNPLIVHIAAFDQLLQVAASVPEKARLLAERFWPGPLTLVLPKRQEIPSVVTAGKDTVAVRMPSSPVALELIRRAGTPVAAPSANAFSCTSPTTARHVVDQLGDRCDLVIDGGACRVGVESTVVAFDDGRPVVLRPGGIPFEEILHSDRQAECLESSATHGAESPGQYPNHYAPRTPLSVYRSIPEHVEASADVGVLLFQPEGRRYRGPVEVLSLQGDEREATVNFYAALQRLDALGLREIAAQAAPDRGMGRAINNRLSKAANGRVEQGG